MKTTKQNKIKKIHLCADDYGMSVPINKGIIQLLNLGRLSAVSCATNYSHWKHSAKKLLPFIEQINIGLHFNLDTTIINLIIKSYTKQLKPQAILQELRMQYNEFIKYIGHAPAYIDGHQHIHSLPTIRECIIKFCSTHAPQIPMRMTQNKQKTLKGLIINSLGAHALYKASKKENLILNKDLVGIYNFNQSDKYSFFFDKFLSLCSNNSLIMCHPATVDTHDAFRYNELKFFCGDNFITLLKKHNCMLKKT